MSNNDDQLEYLKKRMSRAVMLFEEYCELMEEGLDSYLSGEPTLKLLLLQSMIYHTMITFPYHKLLSYRPQLTLEKERDDDVIRVFNQLRQYFREEDEDEIEDDLDQQTLDALANGEPYPGMNMQLYIASLLTVVYMNLRQTLDQYNEQDDNLRGNAFYHAHMSFILHWGGLLLRSMLLLHEFQLAQARASIPIVPCD